MTHEEHSSVRRKVKLSAVLEHLCVRITYWMKANFFFAFATKSIWMAHLNCHNCWFYERATLIDLILTTSTISFREVTTLDHEVFNDSMEFTSLVCQFFVILQWIPS